MVQCIVYWVYEVGTPGEEQGEIILKKKGDLNECLGSNCLS